MKALITGGGGFLGSHLTEAWLARGGEAVVLDDFSTGREENLDACRRDPRLRIVNGSVLDAALVGRLVGEADLVFHFAAVVGVRLVIRDPIRTLETNFVGARHVLDAGARLGKKILFASTSEVYGKAPGGAFVEDSDLVLGAPTIGRWGYACSKALAEFYAFAQAKRQGLRFVALRCFNAVGVRQIPDHGMVLPRFVRQAVAGEPLTVFGDGSQSRCFMHVADAVEATLRLANAPDAERQIVNVGNPESVTMLDLARRVIRLAGSRSTILHVDPREVYDTDFADMPSRIPDVSRLERLTGFRPRRGVEEAVREMIAGAL
ncbi:MAG: NAD-dependent epimerase/dehydratase family protein [Verrucomicrobiae bacterium]|nr:NAD-dependent epimerase/dehydratase family protein [Verrucomicrobiae bacterium]